MKASKLYKMSIFLIVFKFSGFREVPAAEEAL